MAHELWTMRDWIFETLAADATLCALIGGTTDPRIKQETAEEGTLYPFIEIRYISPIGGGDFETLNFYRVWTRARFLVVALIDAASFQSLQPIAARIDVLLHKEEGSGLGGIVHYCKREAPHDEKYVIDGIQYRGSGAFWELAASAT